MPILLKRRNGKITPFRNADFIPAFYFIPKSILDRCGSELNSIQKIDHYRKCYHTRVKNITVESLDELKERHAENNGGKRVFSFTQRNGQRRSQANP